MSQLRKTCRSTQRRQLPLDQSRRHKLKVTQSSPVRVESKPSDAKKGGKAGGKGKRGKSEPRVEKRKQQCIHFYRGTCQRGDQCRYEHQVGDDGRPVPVGPEILQRFDEAVKRYNESRAQAQAKPKAAPRGGVTASMIVLEPDDLEHGIVLSTAQTLDNDQYYAMVDSGTNATIVPLHPGMQGEIAECKVPSAAVTGPIVQVYEHNGARRLVVAMPNSATLTVSGLTPVELATRRRPTDQADLDGAYEARSVIGN